MDTKSVKRHKKGLQLIQKTLQLTLPDPTLPEDEDLVPENVILVAIDFENPTAIRPKGQILDTGIEVGLATLDIRKLKSASHTNIISTHNFAAGSPRFGAAASRRFLFGKSTTITITNILQAIEETISTSQSTDIIITGFELSQDLGALRHLNFDLNSSIYAIIDTAWIAKEVFPSFTGGLKDLLCHLKCPYGRLHCAGNDAHFAIRALLLLATWDEPPSERVTMLQRIAYDPIEGCTITAHTGLDPTRALRRKRKKRSSRWKRGMLSLEERQRSKAAEDQRKREADSKSRRARKKQKERDVNFDAQERVRVERAQRRARRMEDDTLDLEYDLSGLDLLT